MALIEPYQYLLRCSTPHSCIAPHASLPLNLAYEFPLASETSVQLVDSELLVLSSAFLQCLAPALHSTELAKKCFLSDLLLMHLVGLSEKHCLLVDNLLYDQWTVCLRISSTAPHA